MAVGSYYWRDYTKSLPKSTLVFRVYFDTPVAMDEDILKSNKMTEEEAIAWAEDQNTPAEKLREAYAYYQQIHHPFSIGHPLARNPNTPPNILVGMSHSPSALKEIAQNPALSLFLLENPNFLAQVQLKKIVDTAFPSQDVLVMLSHHQNPDIANGVQMHVNFSGEAGANWRDEAGLLLAKLHHTARDRYFLNKFQHNDPSFVPDWIWKHLPHREPKKPKPPLQVLISPPSPEFWNEEKLKAIPHVKFLEKKAYIELLETISQSQNADFLQIMAQHPNENARGRVAQNPYTPSEILYQLAKEEVLHGRLVKNPAIPEDLLRKLLENKILANKVVQNPSSPLWALELAWENEAYSAKLRDLLLRHPDTDIAIQKNAFFRTFTWQTDFISFLDWVYHKPRGGVLYNITWHQRLALILNLNKSLRHLHITYENDPNRYVRAAARERLANMKN
jgi:hypothetical protein